MSDQYNLLDEKWIPVLYESGEFGKVSALEALEKSHQIRQLVPNNPMDRVGILRFLIALLYWCQGAPEKETPPDSNDPFPQETFDKLRKNHDRFNLLGDGKRFYQDSASKNLQKYKSINYLLQEIPTGTNFRHFKHSTDFKTGLCASCCALGLLRLPLFTTSGGSGLSPGINGRPPIYAIPLGESLKQTLIYSWKQLPDDEEIGVPIWEKPDIQLEKKEKVPFLTGLTWLPRKVWIQNDLRTKATCTMCGERESDLYTSCLFLGNGTLSSINPIWNDPHVLFRKDRKGDEIPCFSDDSLGAPARSSGQWVSIIKALCERFDGSVQKLYIVKFATVQNDKYLEAVENIISLPELEQHHIAGCCESWDKESFKMNSKSSRSKSLSKSLGTSIRPDIEHQVSRNIPTLLSHGETAWQKAAQQYGPLMQAVSSAVYPGNTGTSVEKRQYISRLKPEIKLNTKKEEKKNDSN